MLKHKQWISVITNNKLESKVNPTKLIKYSWNTNNILGSFFSEISLIISN